MELNTSFQALKNVYMIVLYRKNIISSESKPRRALSLTERPFLHNKESSYVAEKMYPRVCLLNLGMSSNKVSLSPLATSSML